MHTCIIIPCYNEEKRLPIKDFQSFIGKNELHFLFVNDGSSDNTLDVLNTLSSKAEKVSVLDLKDNVGKAEAIRQSVLGLEKSDYQYIGFLDADLATPLAEIKNIINIIEQQKKSVVIGSRVKRLGSNINRRPMRHIFGRIFATLASVILGLPVYDSQCGAKLFTKNIAQLVFREGFKTHWLFDIEILARLNSEKGKKYLLNNVAEYPLNSWQEIEGSKLSLKDFIKVPYQLFIIYKSYAKN